MIYKSIKLFSITIVVMLAGMGSGKTALLQLTHDPLFLSQSVPPAIAVTFDDSGSMAWGFMGENMGNNSATYDSRRFADPTENKMYYNPTIVYEPPIQADGTEMPQANPNSAYVDGFDTSSAQVDLYNNYLPIARYYYYSDGDYQLRFARIPNTTGVDDVSTGNWNDQYPNLANRVAPGRRAFLYDSNFDNGAGNPAGKLFDVPDNQMQNFANWYSYYNTRNKLGKSSISRAFSTFGPSFKISWQQLNNNTTFPGLQKFDATHRNNFFQWLFDVPSSGGTPLRNAFFRAGNLFDQETSYWSVDFNKNLSCQQNFHIAISDGEWNQTWSHSVSQDETTGSALSGDAETRYTNYSGTGEQRIYPKTETGTFLADITFNFWSKDLSALPNDVKLYKGDFTDSQGNQIIVAPNQDDWDVPAFQWNPKNDPAYWQHVVTYNVGMGLEATRVVDYAAGRFGTFRVDNNNNVVATGGREIKACPQHPTITDPKEAVYAQIRAGNCDWPEFAENGTGRLVKVDDVWHSSINSRGDFFSANDPQELIDSLNAVVNNILERLSRGSASTVSSGVITASTRAYSPGFDSSNWSGNMVARPISSDGVFGDAIWDLSCNLTGGYCETTGEYVVAQEPDERNIYIYDSILDTVEEFCECSTGPAIAEFIANSTELVNDLGVTIEEAVGYLKGDRDSEISRGGDLRDRTSVLADIVHGSPTIIRGPGAPYLDVFWPQGSPEADNPYLDFKEDNFNRKNMIYIGSNSGMLHAIEGEGTDEGRESWGFIPSKALENISKLIDPVYNHHSFVDNTPTVADAFINDEWSTVLVSGMRYGGQSFFAIDVSDPEASEPNVLWEFSDEDDVDMGYSYGQAQIARITSTGEWVALIPNGYNNSQPDYFPANDPRNRTSTSGNAVLFVVRLSDGQLLAKLDTGVGDPNTPNGLATPVAVDSQQVAPPTPNLANTNIDIGADFIYAGDLYGNLWRFDIRSSDYSDWESSSSMKKLVAAQGIMEQPITIQPRVVTVPSATSANDLVVMFGTGKYIEEPDRSLALPATQYFVGVFDGIEENPKNLDLNSSDFIEQTMSSGGSGSIGTLSSNPVNIGVDKGWRIELPLAGERVANDLSVLSSELVIGTSIIPAGDDPCSVRGASRLTAFNPLTGGSSEVSENGLFSITVSRIDPDGNPYTEVVEGDWLLVDDLLVGTPPILDNLGGGTSTIVLEGVEGNQNIALQQFTWRRRNWTNLLIE